MRHPAKYLFTDYNKERKSREYIRDDQFELET